MKTKKLNKTVKDKNKLSSEDKNIVEISNEVIEKAVSTDKSEILKKLNGVSEYYSEVQESIGKETSDFFNSLTQDQQILVFCEVARKLKKAELDEGRSYRGVLYGEFGFGPESYGMAQLSGFLELHNSIVREPLDILTVSQVALETYGIFKSKEEIELALVMRNDEEKAKKKDFVSLYKDKE